MQFGEVLEALDRLSTDDQEAVVAILRRRIAEEGRKRVAGEIGEARREFASGGCPPVTADELVREILS
jgi:hypothetical protein